VHNRKWCNLLFISAFINVNGIRWIPAQNTTGMTREEVFCLSVVRLLARPQPDLACPVLSFPRTRESRGWEVVNDLKPSDLTGFLMALMI